MTGRPARVPVTRKPATMPGRIAWLMASPSMLCRRSTRKLPTSAHGDAGEHGGRHGRQVDLEEFLRRHHGDSDFRKTFQFKDEVARQYPVDRVDAPVGPSRHQRRIMDQEALPQTAVTLGGAGRTPSRVR